MFKDYIIKVEKQIEYWHYKQIKMVYVPRISLKTGINPSLVRSFPADGNYTGTQKLLLTQTRIFGQKIGGNMRSGVKVFHVLRNPRNFMDPFRINFHTINRFFPLYKDQHEQDYLRAKKQRRQQLKEKKQSKKKK